MLVEEMALPVPVTCVWGRATQHGDTTAGWDGLAMPGPGETRNHLSGGEGKLLPANELESLGMEFEGEINDGSACLCPYESPLPNDRVNVLIKRYGAGGT